MDSIEAFDNRFGGTQSLFNWVQDLETELGNEARKNPQCHRHRMRVCEVLLGRFGADDSLLSSNMRRALAESHFGIGDRAQGDALYQGWLEKDPEWGWGWIGWADNYGLFARAGNEDPARDSTRAQDEIRFRRERSSARLKRFADRPRDETNRAPAAAARSTRNAAADSRAPAFLREKLPLPKLSTAQRQAMATVVLYDIDSRIPNLALMKLSSYYKSLCCRVVLEKRMVHVRGDLHMASTVFHCGRSRQKVEQLRAIYGNDIEIGGTGIDLRKRLPLEVEACFPDYSLYRHDRYALGFLTRGCHKGCAFCVVPVKEGSLKVQTGGFDDFVPRGQKNLMLLDDNLLAYPGVETLLEEMARRRYAVNFSQTLDIAYLTPEKYALLRRIDYRNARFTRNRIYFSCNHSGTVRRFFERKEMLRGFGEDAVCVVCIYGFDTSLAQDYERWIMLRRLMLVPFFQEYWPVPGVPPRVPERFFDMDLDRVFRLTFRSNGQNWEKYLRWLNRLYFATYGRYYLPLVKIIYRYNNKAAIHRFLARPELLTTRLYDSYGKPAGISRIA